MLLIQGKMQKIVYCIKICPVSFREGLGFAFFFMADPTFIEFRFRETSTILTMLNFGNFPTTVGRAQKRSQSAQAILE